jgi:hypothetical protein
MTSDMRCLRRHPPGDSGCYEQPFALETNFVVAILRICASPQHSSELVSEKLFASFPAEL